MDQSDANEFFVILTGNYHLSFRSLGVGGQVDFIRGASLGYDGLGKPILAFPSVTSKGETRIVPYIKQGKYRHFVLVVECAYT